MSCLTSSLFRRTRHGYLNDDFIDDELEDQEDQEWEMSFNEEDEVPKNKKRRGRPKKIKEEEIEELQHYDDEGESWHYFLIFIFRKFQRSWRIQYWSRL